MSIIEGNLIPTWGSDCHPLASRLGLPLAGVMKLMRHDECRGNKRKRKKKEGDRTNVAIRLKTIHLGTQCEIPHPRGAFGSFPPLFSDEGGVVSGRRGMERGVSFCCCLAVNEILLQSSFSFPFPSPSLLSLLLPILPDHERDEW